MEPIIEKKPDDVSIISEPGALTFTKRKEWIELPLIALEELQNQRITRAFKGENGSVFFLLYNNNPIDHFSENENHQLLVKFSADENRNQRVFCMSLSSEEVAQLRRHKVTIWD